VNLDAGLVLADDERQVNVVWIEVVGTVVKEGWDNVDAGREVRDVMRAI